MRHNSIIEAAKHLTIQQNVSLQVIDVETGKVVQEHTGHNSATNSLLFGIAHHLVGDFLPNEKHGLHPAYSMLSNYVPRYISLGTMGLLNQDQDAHGLPAGIGDIMPGAYDPAYQELWDAYNAAKDALAAAQEALANDCQYWPACDACADCNECADRIGGKKQAVIDAQESLDAAYQALIEYSEELRFVEYMKRRPGYGADGYDAGENNYRDYFGLGYAFTSYDNTEQYLAGDIVTFRGLLYKCIQDTPNPCGPFDNSRWEVMDDIYQPSKGTTVKLELISPSFPREEIAYRDVVPEYQAELPETIDVVFSAMISTGALKQFRPEGQDYIFITEAGLWSKRYWEDSGENGLLAGYRIAPPNPSNWDMTVPENRELLKRQILKVGRNQVVQVVWKIQIGAVESFETTGPSYTLLTIQNHILDSESSVEVEGARMVVAYDDAGIQIVKDAKTNNYIEWTTQSQPKLAYLNDGTYYIIQTEPPEGYKPADIVQIKIQDHVVSKISEAGEVYGTTVTVFNELIDYVPIDILVTDYTSEYNPISGIRCTLYLDAEHTHVAQDATTDEPVTWTTTDSAITWYLKDNTYYLHIDHIIHGYEAGEDVEFIIEDGVAYKTGDAGDVEDNLVHMWCHTTTCGLYGIDMCFINDHVPQDEVWSQAVSNLAYSSDSQIYQAFDAMVVNDTLAVGRYYPDARDELWHNHMWGAEANISYLTTCPDTSFILYNYINGVSYLMTLHSEWSTNGGGFSGDSVYNIQTSGYTQNINRPVSRNTTYTIDGAAYIIQSNCSGKLLSTNVPIYMCDTTPGNISTIEGLTDIRSILTP